MINYGSNMFDSNHDLNRVIQIKQLQDLNHISRDGFKKNRGDSQNNLMDPDFNHDSHPGGF